jgi:hypothetical protein
MRPFQLRDSRLQPLDSLQQHLDCLLIRIRFASILGAKAGHAYRHSQRNHQYSFPHAVQGLCEKSQRRNNAELHADLLGTQTIATATRSASPGSLKALRRNTISPI